MLNFESRKSDLPETRWLPLDSMSHDSTHSETPVPIRLEKTDDRRLLVQWSDGLEQTIPIRKLRDNCRCASCIDKRLETASETDSGKKKLTNVLPVLSLAETLPLDILLMHPVGNYAYNIHFSDGHSSGIFTFEIIRSLG